MAVYTEIPDDDLAAFMAQFDLGPLVSCKGIAEGVENSNYLLRCGAASYILTLYEKRVKEADLPFFVDLLRHLSSRGITCPLPVFARDGSALHRLAGRPAAIMTFLEGLWPKRPTAHHCAAVGEALARLHLAGRDFAGHRDNALSIANWPALAAASAPRADEVQHGLRDMIAAELDDLHATWPRALPAGIIHADLFPDNVFFLGDRLSGLIDFYFACNDLFAYDFAICLNAWCFEPDGSYNLTKGSALIAGYEKVRPLGADEVAALPTLARGAALRFLLTRLVDWLNVPPGALVKPHDPLDYVRRLRFHQRVESARDYGCDT
jgi:homoserine kinase type II